MSSTAISWAWRQMQLKPNQKYVLIACAEFAGMRGENVYPSIARVARMTGYSERQVTRVLAELVDAGVLVLVQPGGWPKGGKPQATEYAMPIYPSQQVGDKLSSTPPSRSVTDCPEVGDGLTPQTTTPHNNLEEQNPDAAAPSSAAVSPIKTQAVMITQAWWESLKPRPAAGSFVGYRRIVEKLLAAGWPTEAVTIAARDCGRTMTIAAMERSLARLNGRTVSYAPTAEQSATVSTDGTW